MFPKEGDTDNGIILSCASEWALVQDLTSLSLDKPSEMEVDFCKEMQKSERKY